MLSPTGEDTQFRAHLRGRLHLIPVATQNQNNHRTYKIPKGRNKNTENIYRNLL